MFDMQDLPYIHAREKRQHAPSIENHVAFILNDPALLLFCVSSSTLAKAGGITNMLMHPGIRLTWPPFLRAFLLEK